MVTAAGTEFVLCEDLGEELGGIRYVCTDLLLVKYDIC